MLSGITSMLSPVVKDFAVTNFAKALPSIGVAATATSMAGATMMWIHNGKMKKMILQAREELPYYHDMMEEEPDGIIKPLLHLMHMTNNILDVSRKRRAMKRFKDVNKQMYRMLKCVKDNNYVDSIDDAQVYAARDHFDRFVRRMNVFLKTCQVPTQAHKIDYEYMRCSMTTYSEMEMYLDCSPLRIPLDMRHSVHVNALTRCLFRCMVNAEMSAKQRIQEELVASFRPSDAKRPFLL